MFNDDTRDAVKGPYDKLEVPGFVNGKKGLEEKIKRGIQGLFDEKEKSTAGFSGTASELCVCP